MKTFKSSVVLLAILLAAMVIVPMVSAESSTGMAIVASPQPSNDLLNPETLEKLPSFQPGIDDKLSYDEEQRLVKHYVPSPAVPESDMARIIISKSWLLQNDKDPQPDIVQVTFPVTWLTKPDVNDNEDTVIFRLPKKMLELDDTNPDPIMITVSYPETMFEGLSNLNEKDSNRPALSSATNQKPAITRAIDRQVRAWYQRDTGYTVTKLIGYMDPTSYSNSGETFRNYDEREIYLDRSGDIIEFITDFTDTGGVYAWVAVYDEGTWSTAWNWLNIDVTSSLQQINYHFYITNGVYDLYLQDTSSGTWYYNSYSDTDNPSTRINWLVGSTEVDTVGGISNYFRTETNAIRDDYTYAGSSWYSPQTTFDWNSFTSDEQYVYIDSWFDGSGRIYSQHIAGQNY